MTSNILQFSGKKQNKCVTSIKTLLCAQKEGTAQDKGYFHTVHLLWAVGENVLFI